VKTPKLIDSAVTIRSNRNTSIKTPEINSAYDVAF